MSIQESTHDLQIFVPKVTFEQIPIKNLVSNQEYQRHLRRSDVTDVQLPVAIPAEKRTALCQGPFQETRGGAGVV